MRSDGNLHGLMMFADDVVICIWSTEHTDEAWPRHMKECCVGERNPSKRVIGRRWRVSSVFQSNREYKKKFGKQVGSGGNKHQV